MTHDPNRPGEPTPYAETTETVVVRDGANTALWWIAGLLGVVAVILLVWLLVGRPAEEAVIQDQLTEAEIQAELDRARLAGELDVAQANADAARAQAEARAAESAASSPPTVVIERPDVTPPPPAQVDQPVVTPPVQ